MNRLSLIIALLALSLPAAALDLNGLKAKLNDLATPPAPAAGTPAPTGGLSQFSVADQIESLKQALNQGAESAVKDLAKQNGYLDNPKVHIPLPDNLTKADRAMRRVGLGKYSDELITSMNHAAEAAVPEARDLLIQAVKNMTVTDAKDILMGNDDAATQYFRRNTESALGGKFKPIVSRAMQKVNLAQAYDRFAGKGVRLGLVDERDAHLDDYITRRALNGLYLMIAEQEKEIRAHPLQATGALARKVFSALTGR